MAAIIGMDSETVLNVTKDIKDVFVANYNSPVQIVITGDKEQINNNLDKFKEAGAKRVIPLSVSGAFHSPFMKPAGETFESYIKDFEFKDTKTPVFTNIDAEETYSGEAMQRKLPKQIYSSVMWTQTINNIMKKGITEFIEAGPGKVLSLLVRGLFPKTIASAP